MNGKVLYETMLARMPPSVNPKPSPADWNLDTALEATSIGALVLRRASRDACTWSLHLTAAPLRLPGRAIKAKLEPEQLKLIKELKGIPMVDK